MKNFYYNKKSQGLPLNVIIIAAICLIVMVVMIAIFTGKISIWGSDMQKCESRGGKCSTTPECADNEVEIKNVAGCEPNACCIEIFEP